MTPTADALKGLVGALREVESETAEYSAFGKPVRAALAAFESRCRLRDDLAFVAAVEAAISNSTNWYPDPDWIEALADAVEATLFGPATKETP